MQKTVFITGADKGLGLSLVGRFMEGGFQVFAGNYLPEKALKKAAENSPDKLTMIGLDVTNLSW